MNNRKKLLLLIIIFIILATIAGFIRYTSISNEVSFISKLVEDHIQHVYHQDKLTITLENLYYIFGIILFISIFFSYLIFKDDHDYRRRKCFIELMKDWNNNNKDGITFIIRNIIKNLSKEQRQKLMNYNEFTVNEDLHEFIKICLLKANIEDDMIKNENGMYLINKKQSIILRQMVVTYLNRVECLLAASIHNISDFELTKEQFIYLTKSDENYEGMINDFGVIDCFPCTIKFIKKCNEQKDNNKKKTG